MSTSIIIPFYKISSLFLKMYHINLLLLISFTVIIVRCSVSENGDNDDTKVKISNDNQYPKEVLISSLSTDSPDKMVLASLHNNNNNPNFDRCYYENPLLPGSILHKTGRSTRSNSILNKYLKWKLENLLSEKSITVKKQADRKTLEGSIKHERFTPIETHLIPPSELIEEIIQVPENCNFPPILDDPENVELSESANRRSESVIESRNSEFERSELNVLNVNNGKMTEAIPKEKRDSIQNYQGEITMYPEGMTSGKEFKLNEQQIDNRTYMMMENALRDFNSNYNKMINNPKNDEQKRTNYNLENDNLNIASKLYRDMVFTLSDWIPEEFFPGSSNRELMNNFIDIKSNSGFDYIDIDPGSCTCLAEEFPSLGDYIVKFPICPKCDARQNACLPRDHLVKANYKGRDVIKRPERFFYDSNINHIVNWKARPFPASYFRDYNKIHNLNTYSNNRFINLDDNCSGRAHYDDPECERLYYYLRTPRGANPVPLRCVKNYLRHGHDLAMDMHDRSESLVSRRLHPRSHTPSKLHFLNNRVTKKEIKLNRESELTLYGTKIMQKRLAEDYGIPQSTFSDLLRHQGFRVTGDNICRDRRQMNCEISMYRTIDGSCNNLYHPSWGQSKTPLFRLLPPRYADGIHSFPVSVTGEPLPNPRFLSSEVFFRENKTEPFYTLAVMQWGQVVAHDFGFHAMDQTEDGGIECCTRDGKPLPQLMQHHSCAPIIIPSKDKFYSRYKQRCINFVRSMTIAHDDCTLGAADQLNSATSFLDLSLVYGSDEEKSNSLRQFEGGRMKVEIRNARDMMPTMTKKSLFCDVMTSFDVCYKAGDVRANQTPQFLILQTILLRGHNLIANILSSINPHWDDERLFQEARRIFIAMYQHITYHDWLPIVLGYDYSQRHNILPRGTMSNYYNMRVNPSTINAFTTAAFRFLHSIVEGNIRLVTPNHEVSKTLRLSDYYLRPQVVEPRDNFESLLRGLISQPIQSPDTAFNEEIAEYLFRSKNEYGSDLVSIDIQRGRDHGLPGYNDYRKICQLEPATDFYDLINEISWSNVEKLRRIYKNVNDIDLYVGASMETRLPGSFLGPTLKCLIGEQFYRSRIGDRYFYDQAGFPHSFTPEQFDEIKKASLSRIICDTSKTITEVQPDSFRFVSQGNNLVSCDSLPLVNLEKWRENPPGN